MESLFSKLLAIASLLFSTGTMYAQKEPNVLLITNDDMNNWIGAVEHKAKTPNIDPHEFTDLEGDNDLQVKLLKYRSLLVATLGITLMKN